MLFFEGARTIRTETKELPSNDKSGLFEFIFDNFDHECLLGVPSTSQILTGDCQKLIFQPLQNYPS